MIALKPVQNAAETAFDSRARRMEEDGWILSMSSQMRVGLASLVPLALVLLCLALPRLVMGLQANKPVGYLVGMMVVGGALGTGFTLAGSLRLSNRGRHILGKQKGRHEALRSGTKWESSGDAGMAVALFGTAVLAGTAVAPLQAWYPRQTGESSFQLSPSEAWAA